MNPVVTNRRSQLAVAATLIGCTLAAADRAEAQAMQFTTVTAATLSGNADAHALPNTNWTGSATQLIGPETYSKTPIPSAFIITYLAAWDTGNAYDRLFWEISSGFTHNWNLIGSFGLTFSQAVVVDFDTSVANWQINGSSLSTGQTIAAGSYTIDWTWSGSASWRPVIIDFYQGSAPAIPLPGAAGLAACGLLGLSRRRRR